MDSDSEYSKSSTKSVQHHLQSERVSKEQQPLEEVTLILKKSKEEDVRKGQAVKRQLVCIVFFLDFITEMP